MKVLTKKSKTKKSRFKLKGVGKNKLSTPFKIRLWKGIGRLIMMLLKVGEKEYKVRFGYNCFCDTDLMDRVKQISQLFSESGVEDDGDVEAIDRVKDLFCCVRDLLFAGFKKYNPVETPQDVGDLLDEYRDGAEEGEDRGLFQLFTSLGNELMDEGFLADILGNAEAETVKVPQDHKKTQKKPTAS